MENKKVYRTKSAVLGGDCPHFSFSPVGEEMNAFDAFWLGAAQFEGYYTADADVEALFNKARSAICGEMEVERVMTNAIRGKNIHDEVF